MKQMLQAAIVAVAVLAVPAIGMAASSSAVQTKPATKVAATGSAAAKAPAKATMHSARGVVKSMDASSLVLSETAGKKKPAREVRFVLDPATQKDGGIAVGSTVMVKYRNDAKQHVATDVRPANGKKS